MPEKKDKPQLLVEKNKKNMLSQTKEKFNSKKLDQINDIVMVKAPQNLKIFKESFFDRNNSDKQNSKVDYKLGSVNNPHPPYPLIARKRGLEGKLILDVKVNKDGTVNNVVVKKSSGHQILDNVSKKTIKDWMFTPAQKYGNAIEDSVLVPIRFILTD